MTWEIHDGEKGVDIVRYAHSLSDFDTLRPHASNRDHDVARRVFNGVDDGVGSAFGGGFVTLSDYLGFARRGWPEGLARMREILGELSFPRATSIKRRPVWSDEGDDVDMGRVYAGDLERAWRRTVRKNATAPQHLRIWTSCSYPGYTSPDKFFWRGAVACVLSDALEEAGYRVQINCHSASLGLYTERVSLLSGHRFDGFMALKLKDYDQPLLLEQVAATTAHAGFLRVAFFAAELSHHGPAIPHMGRSGVFETPEKLPLAEDGDIVIDKVSDEDGARKKIREIMARFQKEEVPT